MKDTQITVRQALQVVQAAKIIENNEYLDSKVAYWMGRLADRCTTISRPALKEQGKLAKQYQLEAKGKTPEEIGELDRTFEEKFDSVLSQQERIDIYPFKRTDFEAGDEFRKPADKDKGETVIKKGQLVVPVKFFTLMGELIAEN
jgi:hypothetical protein